MTYGAVTLGTEDVEWFRSDEVEFAGARGAVFNNRRFVEFVDEVGVGEALRAFHRLHRVVANQMISLAITHESRGDWVARAIHVNHAAKRRRNVLRKRFAAEFGALALESFVAELDATYPRAEWGSRL